MNTEIIKRFIFMGALMLSNLVFSQRDVNAYKYVIVPERFDFLKSANQYDLNALTGFLFKKYGFNTIYQETYPPDLSSDYCLALKANVTDRSSMFATRLTVTLEDCKGNIVFTSKEGRSKEKDFKISYHNALRDAFLSVEELNYTYSPQTSQVALSENEVNTKEIAQEEIIPEVQVVAFPEAAGTYPLLYAQYKGTVLQLVDTTPKVVFSLLKTSMNTLFIIKNKKGVFYKKGSIWIAEFYEGDHMVQESYDVKF
ncbi:hypothetical protein [Ascidiimonas aurantiaca]|uniref:hypothetical protein n=1 Tax=Ascidiimonas aurantiaca TaxID=1685432 RepID=UPI0030EC7C11